jgi:copper homeostasis protein
MIKTEVCIKCDDLFEMKKAVNSAYSAGASTVELCAAMHLDGLTPSPEFIVAARKEFRYRAGLMVMIRPREGGFYYSDKELIVMEKQIINAAKLGADGVVFGVLDAKNNIDSAGLKSIMEVCKKYNLTTTFHRAFDALTNPLKSVDLLIELGVDRILTSGTGWLSGKNALEGVAKLKQIIEAAKGRIEIVIGGGINSGNVNEILEQLPLKGNNISVHAYSGVQENGVTTLTAVEDFLEKVKF